MISKIEFSVSEVTNWVLREDPGFNEFIVKAKRTLEDKILKDQFIPSYTLYLRPWENKRATAYFVTEDEPHPDKLIENIKNENSHVYSVVITKRWMALTHPIVSEFVKNSEFEECLPDKNKDILVLNGINKITSESYIAAYEVDRSALRDHPTSVVKLTELHRLNPMLKVWESALLNKNKRPRFYSSKGQFPVPIPEDIRANTGHLHNDFQKTTLAVHTSISNLVKNITQWKIFDVDGSTELSVEKLFHIYYSCYDPRYKIRDFGNCKRCNQPLKMPFYLIFPNDTTGEIYKSGPINSLDELWRYETLAERKWKEGFQGPVKLEDIHRVHRLYWNDLICLTCHDNRIRFFNVTQLNLTPDSINTDLDQYTAGLVDMSDFYTSSYGYDSCNEDYSYIERLELAFAEENVILNENEQKRLRDLLNNIKEKGRRYPNEEELTRWLNDQDISHCKIFDMRGLNYFRDERLIRFAVIIHWTGLWHSKRLWYEVLIS